MSSPKHLWSGDWQQDSERAARERAARLARGQEPLNAPVEAPVPPRPSAPPLSARLAAQLRRLGTPLAALRAHAPRPRTVLGVWLVALLVVAGAYGVSTLAGSERSPVALGAGSGPWLGVQMEALPVDRVLIAAVVPGGPADQAGLGPGDVITQVNNHPVRLPGDVAAVISSLHPGDKLVIQVQRGPQTYTTQAKLVAQPSNYP